MLSGYIKKFLSAGVHKCLWPDTSLLSLMLSIHGSVSLELLRLPSAEICRWGVTNVLSQGGAYFCWEVSNICSFSGSVIRVSMPTYQVAVSPNQFPSKVTKFDTQWLYPVGLCQIFRLPMWWEGGQLGQTATPEQLSFCRGSELCRGWNQLPAGNVVSRERGTRGNT